MHVLKSGRRWCDCPPEYGPPVERTEITSLLNLTNCGRIFFCFGSRIERRLAKISSSTVRTRRCFSQHAEPVGVDEVFSGPAVEIVFGHTFLGKLLQAHIGASSHRAEQRIAADFFNSRRVSEHSGGRSIGRRCRMPAFATYDDGWMTWRHGGVKSQPALPPCFPRKTETQRLPTEEP